MMKSAEKCIAWCQINAKPQIARLAPCLCVWLVACGGYVTDGYRLTDDSDGKQDATCHDDAGNDSVIPRQILMADIENSDAHDTADWWAIYARDYGESALHVCDLIAGRWRGAQPHQSWMPHLMHDLQERSRAVRERSEAHARDLMAAHQAGSDNPEERVACWSDPVRVEGCSHGPKNTFTWLKSRVHCARTAQGSAR